MPFFKPLDDPEPEERRHRPAPRRWDRPHPGELGGFVPVRLELARTEEHIVLLGPMEAHPNGVAIDLEVRSRRPDLEPMGWHGDPADGLRFGIEFSDGRNTEVSRRFWDQLNEPGDGPVLLPSGGGGGGGVYRHHYWLWPLPPEGEMRFHLVWPEASISETATTVDASIIRDAASSAETLWARLTPEEEREAMRTTHRRMAGSGFTLGSVAFASDGGEKDEATERGEDGQSSDT